MGVPREKNVSLDHVCTQQGVNNIVVHAADVPTKQKERAFKTDKRDCRKIARSLSNEELDAIYVPSLKTQQDRTLVRLRLTFRKDLSAQASHIHMEY